MDEEEMKRAAEEMSSYAGMPKPITLTLCYDKELQKITGRAEHPAMMSMGATFGFLLHSVLAEYPEITKRYPPGVLGFTVNDTLPKIYSPLFDGDRIVFSVSR